MEDRGRKIIGIGETIMDIIFKNGKPTAAVPGGSTFNGIISLGRLGLDVSMISETGNDKVGDIIMDFMKDNGVDNSHVAVYATGRSAISLAWLNERNDAEYMFYKDYPAARLEVDWPRIKKDDIVMMGSYFVLNPVLRPKVKQFLEYARRCGALIYYDFNFRRTHKQEAIKIYADMLENLEYADIVRGSEEDFMCLYNLSDANTIYKDKIQFYCKNFIYTAGAKDVQLRTTSMSKGYAVPAMKPVSTVGAGDNFNAGLVYGLLKQDIEHDDLPMLGEKQWDELIDCGMKFSAVVCMSTENSVPLGFKIEN